MKIKISGIDFDVAEPVAQALEAERTMQIRADADAVKLRAESEAAKGRADALVQEVVVLKAKIVDLEDPKRLDSKITDRAALVEKARKVLGQKAEVKGTDREIMETVLRKDSKDDFAAKSLEYIQARFDAKIEGLSSEALAALARSRVAAATTDEQRQDSKDDSRTARQRMLERNANAWKEPLTVSTQKD